MPEDRIIWQKFIYHGQFLPQKVWYDVRVGKGVKVATGQPEWMIKFAEYSYKKRIDIIGTMGPDFIVIECKPFAGVVALGQIIFYSLAFMEYYKPDGEVIPAIITDQVDPDLMPIFEQFGVLVFEVGTVTDADHQKISQIVRGSINKKGF